MIPFTQLTMAIPRLAVSALALLVSHATLAQVPTQARAITAENREDPRPAPNRPRGEGDGPFQRLIVRGAILIDGTGGPPRGPVDIVIENNRIADITNVGTPG